MRRRRFVSVAAVMLLAGVALTASSALAASMTYEFTGGTADLSIVNVSTGEFATDPAAQTILLDGVQVTVDTGALELVSMELTSAGPWNIALDSTKAGGYDVLTIALSSLTAYDGTLTFNAPTSATEDWYSFVIADVLVQSVISASGPGATSFTNVPVSLITDSASGDIFVEPFILGSLTMDGVTIGEFQAGGETYQIKADFVFEGVQPIPEPSAAILFGVGALVVAGATRLRKRSQ